MSPGVDESGDRVMRRILVAVVVLGVVTALAVTALRRPERERRSRTALPLNPSGMSDDNLVEQSSDGTQTPAQGSRDDGSRSRGIRGFVEREDGTRIGNATIALSSLQEPIQSALATALAPPLRSVKSAQDGSFDVREIDANGPFLISATAPARVPAVQLVTDASVDSGPIVLRLAAAREIRGVVEDPAGVPVANATIVAWDARGFSPFERLHARYAPQAVTTMRIAKSAIDGRFRLEGVAPDCSYRIIAASADQIAERAWVEARSGESDVRVGVRPLHLVWIKPVGDSGEEIERDARVVPHDSPSATWSCPKWAEIVSDYEWRLLVPSLVLPNRTRPELAGPHDVRIWFAGVPDSGASRRISVTLLIPGYQRKRIDALLEPVSSHPGQPTRIPVESVADRFGRIQVDTTAPDDSSLLGGRAPGQVRLILDPEGAGGQDLEVDCATLSQPHSLLRGIPAGSYSVRTESIHPGASAAPERIRVSVDDTPRIRITLPKITSVILEFDAVPRSMLRSIIDGEIRFEDEAAELEYRFPVMDYFSTDLMLVPGSYRMTIEPDDPAAGPFELEPATVEVGTNPVHAKIVIGRKETPKRK